MLLKRLSGSEATVVENTYTIDMPIMTLLSGGAIITAVVKNAGCPLIIIA